MQLAERGLGIPHMNQGRLSLTVVAVGVAFASSAAAQVTPDAMLHGRPSRTMDVEAHARVEHDSNIARTDADLAAARGISRADTLYLPSVSADIVVPVGQQAVFLRGFASYVFHDKNSRLDHSRYDLTGGVGSRLGPCGSVVSAGYTRGRSELQDFTLVTTVNNILEVKHLAASLTCVRAPGLGVYGSVSRDWGSSSVTTVTNGDYVATHAQGGLRYSRAATGSIGLIGLYGRTEYKDRPVAAFTNDGYEMRGGGLELARRLGGRIQANASISYVHVEPLSALPGTQTNFNGYTYSADVSYRATSRLNGQLTFSRNISPTLIQGQSFEVQTLYGASGDYRIGSRFSLGLHAEQRKSDSRGVVLPTGNVLTQSRTRAYESSLTYRLNKRLSFVLTAAREERRADNPDFDYNNDRVGLSADFAF